MSNFKGFGKQPPHKESKIEKEFLKGFNLLCGGDEQAEAEISNITNEVFAREVEKLVRKRGYTLLVPIIRKYYQEFGNVNPLDFGRELAIFCDVFMFEHMPEKDSLGSIAYLKTQFGYTDEDFPPLD